jgi:RNase adapter protein RapZ
MQEMIADIKVLFENHFEESVQHIEVLPQSGSDRRYFRIHSTINTTYIATYGNNKRENKTFVYFANHFVQKKLAVPTVLAVNADESIYIQEDFGNTSLLNVLEKEGFSKNVYSLFQKSLHELANLQFEGDKDLDYNYCLTNKEFGKQAILADLLYFKYYFLDALKKPYDKQQLIEDFEALSSYLTHTEYKYFMFRDFQSRNILIDENGEPKFIDFQGGMKGAPQYDVASMLWQAKADLPEQWKESLLDDYIKAFSANLKTSIDETVFRSQYYGYVLIRLLQVLGAYGFRGLFERKAHFLTSIPLALKNLQWFVRNKSIGIALPAFKKVLDICISDEVIQQFTPLRADEKTPLKISINSFSYKKGIPKDESTNGGGFVFDMRGILNPGRFDGYKHLSGKDTAVIEFLEQQTRMPELLNAIFNAIDISVEDYLKRGFDSLQINFGCTGGQHRSVYGAEQAARHLKNKYNLQAMVSHTNQANWVTTISPAKVVN